MSPPDGAGTGEPEPRQPLRAGDLLRFVGRFAALAVVVTVGAWAVGLTEVIERALVAATELALPHVEGSHIGRVISLADGRWHLTTSFAGKVFRVSSERELHGHNILLFAALVLASPRLQTRYRLLGLALGCAAVFATDVLIGMADVWHQDRTLADAPPVPGNAVAALARVLHQYHLTGGAWMMPMFVWVFILVGPSLAAQASPRSRQHDGEEPASRQRQ